MKKNKTVCLLALLSVFALAGCGGETSSNNGNSNSPSNGNTDSTGPIVNIDIPDAPEVDMSNEDSIYDDIFGTDEFGFWKYVTEAKEISDDSERYVAFAKAEAELLSTNAFMPTTTQGGSYALTHAAYRSTPYVEWGLDSDRVENIVLINDALITKAERDEMEVMWKDARANNKTYDPTDYLVGKGHTINRDYVTIFSEAPKTLDILASNRQGDSTFVCNGLEGLMKYDNLGNQQYAIAKSHTVSDDGKTYTFELRDDVYWVKSDGQQYGKVTAQDFVDGFHHVLDANSESGLGNLVDGIVLNAGRYMKRRITDFSQVGIKANSETELVITLEKPTSYFMTMLTYTTFMPLNGAFYRANGGAFGISDYNKAKANVANYKYGRSNPDSILYNSAYYFNNITDGNEMAMAPNEFYYNKANRKIDSIKYVFDQGTDANDYYNKVKTHQYLSCSLTNKILPSAKADGLFEKCAFVSATGSTTYFSGNNLNRQKYDTSGEKEFTSKKTSEQKEATRKAMVNLNFRKAINYAFDRTTWNAVVKGNDLATSNLRNMYTTPDFVRLSKDVTADGMTFKANEEYGSIVQKYIDKFHGGEIKVDDGIDGWYNPDLAKAYIKKAAQELGITKDNPIVIDTLCLDLESESINQAKVYAESIQDVLEGYVIVDTHHTSNQTNYLNASYYATKGADVNYDVYAGSGWGPDYGDPSTYLDTFLGEGAGAMTKIVGLY